MSTVSYLLAVENRKGTSDEKRIRTFPVILAGINLFFCAYMDQYLRYDTNGHYLAMLLFIECSVMVLIAVGTFSKKGTEILLKTSVFPVTSWSRMVFIVLSFVRKPAVVALWLTTILFFIVFFYPSLLVICLAISLFSFLVLITMLLTGIVCIKLTRSSQPIAGLTAISIFIILVVLISSIVFHLNVFLTSSPILSWVVNGILAAQHLRAGAVVLNGAYLIMMCIVLLLFGKRFA